MSKTDTTKLLAIDEMQPVMRRLRVLELALEGAAAFTAHSHLPPRVLEEMARDVSDVIGVLEELGAP